MGTESDQLRNTILIVVGIILGICFPTLFCCCCHTLLKPTRPSPNLFTDTGTSVSTDSEDSDNGEPRISSWRQEEIQRYAGLDPEMQSISHG